MLLRTAIVILACSWLGACATRPAERSARSFVPLTIGESFAIDSRILGEPRRINIFIPTIYGQPIDGPLPVLYMLDGGMDEDFLHIAGLVQILVSDGSVRPVMLVGIPNTVRRRDLTGPTVNPRDLAIAPVVGGSAKFRRFIGEELMPVVRRRYRTTDEAVIMGESLAGLFVVETCMLEPGLFRAGIAIDPSLWWSDRSLLRAPVPSPLPTLWMASSGEPELARDAAAFAGRLAGIPGFRYIPMPGETHGTIYHPAALLALRTVLAAAK